MIEPFLRDEAFLSDVLHTSQQGQAFRLWWLGQSGFLVQWEGRHLLFDPYLSESLTEKYSQTDKPHTRMTRRVVSPDALSFIDVITSSHNHTDHLDGDTLKPLLRASPTAKLIVGEANRLFAAERLGIDAASLLTVDAGSTVVAGHFSVTGIPSAHETVERDAAGRCKFLGFVVSFGRWTIYHSGDTVWYRGLEERLRAYEPTVALLPINGRAHERRVAGNLTGSEAARLAKVIRARVVIPCHFEMFEFNTESPEEFVRTAKELDQPHRVLRAGESWSSAALECPL